MVLVTLMHSAVPTSHFKSPFCHLNLSTSLVLFILPLTKGKSSLHFN